MRLHSPVTKLLPLDGLAKRKFAAQFVWVFSLNKKTLCFPVRLDVEFGRIQCSCYKIGAGKGGQFRLQDGNAASCLTLGSLGRIPAPAPRQRGCRPDESGAAHPSADPVGDECPKPSRLTTHFSSLIRPIVSQSLTLIPTRGHHLLFKRVMTR